MVTKPTGRAVPTISPSSVKPSTCATTSTRQVLASSATRISTSANSAGASTNCAAPITNAPSAKDAPLHFFADENGITRSGFLTGTWLSA